MDPFIGEITIFAGNFTPEGWLPCNGQLLEIQNYQALFSILGTTYGGDGRTDFALPDLRCRVPIGVNENGAPDIPYYNHGSRGGNEYVTLATHQLPAHKHVYKAEITVGTELACGDANGTSQSPQLHYFGQSVRGDKLYTDTLTNPVEMNAAAGLVEVLMRGETEIAGGGQGHYNMAPYLAVNYIICNLGVYPGR